VTNDQNQLVTKIHIPSELGYEKVVMSAIAVIAQKMGFPEEKIEDLKTAVSEACANAIEHGNSLNVQDWVVVICTFDPTSIHIDVIDQGHKPLPKDLPDRSTRTDFRGMGLFLMQMLMDKIELISQPGRNEVKLTCLKNPGLVPCI
jgi:serine/threonine-protein kinase RsbW